MAKFILRKDEPWSAVVRMKDGKVHRFQDVISYSKTLEGDYTQFDVETNIEFRVETPYTTFSFQRKEIELFELLKGS